MNHWLRRNHLIFTVGGGFTGLAVSLATLIGNWSGLTKLAVILVLAFCALCGWAIVVGLRLSEGAADLPQLRLFYLIQIPNFTSPLLSFHAGFGVMLYLGSLPNGQNIQAQLGADWNGAILNGNGWTFAINVIPIILLWFIRPSATR